MTIESTFTMVPDHLVDEMGLLHAMVFGAVWRYSQMKDGVCNASVSTIATRCGLSYKTTLKCLHELCDDEYLFDLSPGLRNKPHAYVPTRKLKYKESVAVSAIGV